MKMYGGVDLQIHVLLISALAGGVLSASCPGRFTPGERAAGTLWIGGWVGPRTGMDAVEKRKFFPVSGLELQPLYRPARSQSLYRLSYPGYLYLSIYLYKNCMREVYQCHYAISDYYSNEL
jgi:hypothetical protein